MQTWTRRVPPPRHRRAPAPAAAYLLLGGLYVTMVALSGTALVTGFASYDRVAELARFAFGVFGLVAAVRAARTTALPPRLRQAWGAVAACFAVLVASTPVLVFAVDEAGSAAADISHVIFVVALIIALQRFPLAPMNRRDRLKTGLDALTVLVGGSMVLWYLAFDPYVERHGLAPGVIVSAMVYPIGDLALLFVASLALLRGADRAAQRPLRLLTAGTLVLFVGDAVHGYLNGHDLATQNSWQFVCWITADALLAAAAVEQCRASGGSAREPRPGFRWGRFLPFAAVAVAHLLMLGAAVDEGRFSPWGGLALGGAALSALVLFRQTLVQRETDEQARTDALTGLANRGLFRATSYRTLERGARTGQHSAILVIDMNGFKEINDSFGHKAGDLALVAFAEVLRRCVPAPGLPARLGGDEFAVVLPDVGFPERAYELAGRIAAALGPVAIEGRLITLAASIGVAVSAPGQLTHDELVHRADLAMYRAKALGPDTRWAIWQESLEPSAEPAAVAA
ncbi:GGDEF domain-containing protein [Actinoplanes sp. NPDC024001]|uniref:GGDEF domain-containing protein n=1 Tax=Actinoplanes sp. NPDC024001 TaxID=3154598 RepID=UPI0033E9D24F